MVEEEDFFPAGMESIRGVTPIPGAAAVTPIGFLILHLHEAAMVNAIKRIAYREVIIFRTLRSRRLPEPTNQLIIRWVGD